MPHDLQSVRLKHTYRVDGRLVGWRQRTRRGLFGPELRLEAMELRKVDGVYRPQPKIDRRSEQQLQARPRVLAHLADIRDHRREFSRAERYASARRQHNLCLICELPFTKDNPPVGGHDFPHTYGGTSADGSGNCIALHASCNSRQGIRTLKEFKSQQRLFIEGGG